MKRRDFLSKSAFALALLLPWRLREDEPEVVKSEEPAPSLDSPLAMIWRIEHTDEGGFRSVWDHRDAILTGIKNTA